MGTILFFSAWQSLAGTKGFLLLSLVKSLPCQKESFLAFVLDYSLVPQSCLTMLMSKLYSLGRDSENNMAAQFFKDVC